MVIPFNYLHELKIEPRIDNISFADGLPRNLGLGSLGCLGHGEKILPINQDCKTRVRYASVASTDGNSPSRVCGV
jgi:hypothetical protein